MNITCSRLRYSQLFILCILVVVLYIAPQVLELGAAKPDSDQKNSSSLVALFTSIRLTIGDRVFLQTIVGKNGWFFYRMDLNNRQNGRNISTKDLKITQQRIQGIYNSLQKRNITMLLVIAPDKSTIYSYQLPDQIQSPKAYTRMDALRTYLVQHGPPVLVDLQQALLEAKKTQDVYYKTDTHWNANGAFVGYTQIMLALSKTYPQLTPDPLSAFKRSDTPPYAHDLLRIMGAPGPLEVSFQYSWKEKGSPHAKDSPSLLMYMDSFGAGLLPFMTHHFREVNYVMSNPRYAPLQSMQEIDRLKPNVVIIEVVERYVNGKVVDAFLSHFFTPSK
jgi:hypothetical protein